MTRIVEDGGYRLDRDRKTPGTYSLFLTYAGREQELPFDRVSIDDRPPVLLRDIPRWGFATVATLDPGVLETDVGTALEAIAEGEDPREVVEA